MTKITPEYIQQLFEMDERLDISNGPVPVLQKRLDDWRANVKKAYRIQAKKHHPDMGGDPARFRHIQEVWEMIQKLEVVVRRQPQPQFNIRFYFDDSVGSTTSTTGSWTFTGNSWIFRI